MDAQLKIIITQSNQIDSSFMPQCNHRSIVYTHFFPIILWFSQ